MRPNELSGSGLEIMRERSSNERDHFFLEMARKSPKPSEGGIGSFSVWERSSTDRLPASCDELGEPCDAGMGRGSVGPEILGLRGRPPVLL